MEIQTTIHTEENKSKEWNKINYSCTCGYKDHPCEYLCKNCNFARQTSRKGIKKTDLEISEMSESYIQQSYDRINQPESFNPNGQTIIF